MANNKEPRTKHLWLVEDVPAKGDRPSKSFWTKIGVAFENRDGSYSLHLAAIPVSGKLQMRDPSGFLGEGDTNVTGMGSGAENDRNR